MSEAVIERGILRWVLPPLTFLGEVTLLIVEGFRRLFSKPFEAAEAVNQMAFVGVASVPIVAITTFASGAVMALYISPLLLQIGAGNMAGGVITLTVARELGPVVAGIMVAARCGSAMAAQIGSMAVTEQVDALRSLSVHPYNYLVVPRMIAGITMVPILGLLGVYCGVGGGLVIASVYGIPPETFLRSLEVWVDPWDWAGGVVKTIVFGLLVTIVACQQGLRTTGGAVGVGRATTNAVVISMVLIYVVNYFLAAWFY
jgi:phospholipid/cholesterol/gamma-HCH transport system permease protein